MNTQIPTVKTTGKTLVNPCGKTLVNPCGKQTRKVTIDPISTNDPTSTNPVSNSQIDSNLLNNSIQYLIEYRKLQAKKLQMRLSVFTKVVMDKFGSINKIKQDGCAPIESQRDIDMINKLISLETFATIPVFTSDGTAITHFYTIGLWYYWGIPEIVFKFDTPIRENAEFINVVINIIHDKLFAVYRDRIVSNKRSDINRINFESEPETLVLNLENFGIDFKMNRVDNNQYMDIKAMFMLWFYMYYMDAIVNEKKEPCLYPVYQINIDSAQYSKTCKLIIDKLLSSAVAKLNIDQHSETQESSESESDSESEDSRLSTIDEVDEQHKNDIQESEQYEDEIENLDDTEDTDAKNTSIASHR